MRTAGPRRCSRGRRSPRSATASTATCSATTRRRRPARRRPRRWPASPTRLPGGGQVHLSYGDEQMAEYVHQLAADHLIHAWDLAAAAGGDTALDSELVAAMAAWFVDREELYRAGGVTGPRVDDRPATTRRRSCSPPSAATPAGRPADPRTPDARSPSADRGHAARYAAVIGHRYGWCPERESDEGKGIACSDGRGRRRAVEQEGRGQHSTSAGRARARWRRSALGARCVTSGPGPTVSAAPGDEVSSLGTEFWLAFHPQPHGERGDLTLFITARDRHHWHGRGAGDQPSPTPFIGHRRRGDLGGAPGRRGAAARDHDATSSWPAASMSPRPPTSPCTASTTSRSRPTPSSALPVATLGTDYRVLTYPSQLPAAGQRRRDRRRHQRDGDAIDRASASRPAGVPYTEVGRPRRGADPAGRRQRARAHRHACASRARRSPCSAATSAATSRPARSSATTWSSR